MAEQQSNRTEQPTGRHKKRARDRGQVVRSKELQSSIVLFLAVVGLRAAGPWMMQRTMDRWSECLQLISRQSLTAAELPLLAQSWFVWTAQLLLPLFAIVAVAATGSAAMMQGGLLFVPRLAMPDLSRIDPLAGFRRMFSAGTGFGLLRDLLKVAVVGAVCWVGIREMMTTMAAGLDFELPALLGRVEDLAGSIALRVALVLVASGLIDWMWQRRRYNQDLLMSRQEVKEEQKEAEGDPIIKSRIRSRQRDLARRRMMEAVPTADVVLTNPTHLAVALKYEAGSMGAPRVVAKGERLIAQRIKELARKHGVPVIEDKPLARALFRMAPVGAEIPGELYRAVAEVLGYVYRLKGRVATSDGGKR